MHKSPLIDLTDVTLCAIDTVNPLLAARALDISMLQCRFGDAILFSHQAVLTRARTVQIAALRSLHEYSDFVLKELVKHVATPWVLVVQWDGYVVDATQWTDEFRQYDYIGARWPHAPQGMDVGNGGFSLRSARLLKALVHERFAVGSDSIEDVMICDRWRPALEMDHGIRFAPAEIADRFSYEYAFPVRPTFGFHGVHNLWRHIDDPSMIDLIETMDLSTLTSLKSVSLLLNYCDLRKFKCVRTLYGRYRAHWSADEILRVFINAGTNEKTARWCLGICEASLNLA
ncbi:DUF5672 family protein [Paraburkholderia sp. J63]|uniref:DUF5672 family protein n=1 Tax=Paraburkholderia sp. J63 TaxID=2805434 RepID=UPI002ABE9258|nr:DUF5672 family protein [Paraburkholderia sp. J63]